MLPATKIFLALPSASPVLRKVSIAASAASLAILAPSNAILDASAPHPYSSWDILLALNVFASIMSAPAAIYLLWIFLMMSGRDRLRHSLLPLSSFSRSASGIPARKSSSVSPHFCIIVPVAPSRIIILPSARKSVISQVRFNRANIHRSREQCKLACNCRGATV